MVSIGYGSKKGRLFNNIPGLTLSRPTSLDTNNNNEETQVEKTINEPVHELMAQAPPSPKAALSPLPRVSLGSTSASTYSTSEGFEIVIDSDSDDEKAATSNKREAEEEAAPVAAKASKAEADSSPAESPAPVTAPVAALPTLTVAAPLLPPVAAPVPRVIAPVSPATCHNEEQGLPPPRSKFHQWQFRNNAKKVSPSDHGFPPSVTIYRTLPKKRPAKYRYFIILEDGTEYHGVTSVQQARNHLNLSQARMAHPSNIYKGDPLQVILNLQTTSVKTQVRMVESRCSSKWR
jgi:hypothetical protein